jgi:hypothetical protein|nr:MAG TPA: hypothetical protein [Caudoviricetes sp.]
MSDSVIITFIICVTFFLTITVLGIIGKQK